MSLRLRNEVKCETGKLFIKIENLRPNSIVQSDGVCYNEVGVKNTPKTPFIREEKSKDIFNRGFGLQNGIHLK